MANLRNARGLVANLIPSLDFCIAAGADAGAIAQQAGWIVGELEHAAAQIRAANRVVWRQRKKAEEAKASRIQARS